MGRIKNQDELFKRLITGDRNALAQAITLIENEHSGKALEGAQFLNRCRPLGGKAIRMAVSGPPGAGKSTLIDVLGTKALEKDYKVAVLAVDPSSKSSGGSILGDKTRMSALTARASAFVRASPTGGYLGGTASSTHDAILICEAAGYDLVIIETVGVGQSETDAYYLSDCFVLITIPGSGDVLQGIKKGIMELSDIVVVNKADKHMKDAAQRAVLQLQEALHFGSRHCDVPVCTTSATEGHGIESLIEEVLSFVKRQQAGGAFAERRQDQASFWLRKKTHEYCLKRIDDDPLVRRKMIKAEKEIQSNKLHSRQAAIDIVSAFFYEKQKKS